MTEPIAFYHNPFSRGRTVRWMLEEVGALYEVKALDFAKGEHKARDYLTLNPMGKIPTIVHRGVAVTECAAICAYLADAFPSAGLAPPIDDPRRGSYYRWMFFTAGCVEPAVIDRMRARAPVERTTALGYGTYQDAIGALHTAIEPGPFVLGDSFSAADVLIGAQIAFATMMKGLDPDPQFAAYVARCMARPAAIRAKALDEALAKG